MPGYTIRVKAGVETTRCDCDGARRFEEYTADPDRYDTPEGWEKVIGPVPRQQEFMNHE